MGLAATFRLMRAGFVLAREGALSVVDTSALPTALAALQDAGIGTLTATPPTLEELFMRHYGDDVSDTVSAAGGAGS